MDCPLGEEAEMPIPINSAYGHTAHAHMIQHHHNHHHHQHQHNEPLPQPLNHIIPSSAPPPPPLPTSNGTTTSIAEQMQIHWKHQQQEQEGMAVVRYRECLKNHAAAMGGNATDGCGEFMPSGEEGTIEALTCSACHCHRNFHRKEVEGELPSPSTCECHQLSRGALGGRKLLTYPNQHHHHYHHSSTNKGMLAPEPLGYSVGGGGALVPAARSVPIMPLSSMALLPSSSEEQEGGGAGGSNMGRASPHYQVVKKRFRTKFTKEQKEKMLNFAERVGWKMQKLEESVVQQFCQEVGIKRRVLKVWMHNNKHNLAKKPNSPSA